MGARWLLLSKDNNNNNDDNGCAIYFRLDGDERGGSPLRVCSTRDNCYRESKDGSERVHITSKSVIPRRILRSSEVGNIISYSLSLWKSSFLYSTLLPPFPFDFHPSTSVGSSLIETSNFRLHSPSAWRLQRIQRALCRKLETRERATREEKEKEIEETRTWGGAVIGSGGTTEWCFEERRTTRELSRRRELPTRPCLFEEKKNGSCDVWNSKRRSASTKQSRRQFRGNRYGRGSNAFLLFVGTYGYFTWRWGQPRCREMIRDDGRRQVLSRLQRVRG